MCCTRLAGNTGRKNYAKKSTLRTIAQLCRVSTCVFVIVTKACIDNRKKLVKQQYHLHMSPHNFGPLMAEISWWVCRTPANFNGFRVLASLLHRRRSRRPTKLCTMFGRLLGWYTIYTFSGALAPDAILPGATCTLRPVLRSPILAALLYGTPAVGVSQTLRRGRLQGMELRNFLY